MVETDEERILESPHPHDRGVDEVYPLDFPGADGIQVHRRSVIFCTSTAAAPSQIFPDVQCFKCNS